MYRVPDPQGSVDHKLKTTGLGENTGVMEEESVLVHHVGNKLPIKCQAEQGSCDLGSWHQVQCFALKDLALFFHSCVHALYLVS
ncbi:hypothetical protein Y1Q_0018403 [Alligator mississippiensis]|uniref:Uncharacterized protein n=1 Tax=Alligator mississippiensis TaxID=8496 RepID=A0A151PCH4_ALLMI|nr:hypothetical protein Y1Q_0018403 [Alligator mississippiensis]